MPWVIIANSLGNHFALFLKVFFHILAYMNFINNIKHGIRLKYKKKISLLLGMIKLGLLDFSLSIAVIEKKWL